MAQGYEHHNNSAQMWQILHPNENPEGGLEDKCKHQGDPGGVSPRYSPSSSSSPEPPPFEDRRDRPEAGADALSSDHLGQLKFSKTHTVLVDVSVFNAGLGIIPQEGRDLWSKGFVKMPCSQASVISCPTGYGKQQRQVCRWEIIHKKLKHLAGKKEVDVEDVEKAILKYNPKYKGQWAFDALSTFVKCIPKKENYFPALFPKIAALALELPGQVKKAIPLLQTGRTTTLTLSQAQISCLLANAFFCTFPHRNTSSPNAEYHNYPTINFTSLFGYSSARKTEKLRAIMHYFKVVTDERSQMNGLVTFERRCLRDTDLPRWKSCKAKLAKLQVMSEGSIETDGKGMLQVDFACNLIGGGVLGSGLVQEEILFLMNPELIVSRLFTERLGNTECLIITGSQQFSRYSGFSDTFKWAGPHEDCVGRDKWMRLKRQILAIDALNFKHAREQYSMSKIKRELNKAFCGFKGHGHAEPDIATGKWGCGAFNGDPRLKALIQLMAAARAQRGLTFFTFGDKILAHDLQQIHHLLVTEGVTVDWLYRLLKDYCTVQTNSKSHVDLFKFIGNAIGPSKSQL